MPGAQGPGFAEAQQLANLSELEGSGADVATKSWCPDSSGPRQTARAARNRLLDRTTGPLALAHLACLVDGRPEPRPSSSDPPDRRLASRHPRHPGHAQLPIGNVDPPGATPPSACAGCGPSHCGRPRAPGSRRGRLLAEPDLRAPPPAQRARPSLCQPAATPNQAGHLSPTYRSREGVAGLLAACGRVASGRPHAAATDTN